MMTSQRVAEVRGIRDQAHSRLRIQSRLVFWEQRSRYCPPDDSQLRNRLQCHKFSKLRMSIMEFCRSTSIDRLLFSGEGGLLLERDLRSVRGFQRPFGGHRAYAISIRRSRFNTGCGPKGGQRRKEGEEARIAWWSASRRVAPTYCQRRHPPRGRRNTAGHGWNTRRPEACDGRTGA